MRLSFHTHYWYEVGMLKVPAMCSHNFSQRMDEPGKVANPARGQLNRENGNFPVPVRANGFGGPIPRQPAHSPYAG